MRPSSRQDISEPALPSAHGGFFKAHREARLRAEYECDSARQQNSSGRFETGGESLSESAVKAQRQREMKELRDAEAAAGSMFLEKLTLRFLERLWVAIKKKCMENHNAAKGDVDGIYAADFLKLAKHQLAGPTKDDERFLAALFSRVDRRKKGYVRPTTIATALVLICREDPITKLRTLFKVFDADDDCCLTPDEIFDMYLSIKCNDVTKDRTAIVADITFDDELSLQDAKRLYERTVEHLNQPEHSDFIIFEEFKSVFDRRPGLLEGLLPGTFSLEWILRGYEGLPTEPNSFGAETRHNFIKALRHGENDLELSEPRGRGIRIMQNCLKMPPGAGGEGTPRPQSGESSQAGMGRRNEAALTAGADIARTPRAAQTSRTPGGVGALPKLTSANRAKPQKTGGKGGAGCNASAPATARTGSSGAAGAAATSRGKAGGAVSASPRIHGGDGKVAEDHDESESDSDGDDNDSHDDEEEVGGVPSGTAAVGRRGPGGNGSNDKVTSKSTYNIDEARELPLVQVQTMQHKNAHLFRQMRLDSKTQQAFARQQDVNRILRFQCAVCGLPMVQERCPGIHARAPLTLPVAAP